ncbi:MAG: VWA domain-containing protein [Planctomycetota bacterium]|nr:VWA domain-containing protein [Planctomycetota bacterium]
MLGNLSISIGRPWWLIVLPIVLPPLVLFSYRGLSGLGRVRRWLALLVRVSVITLIVLALARVQAVRKNDKLTTLFLLDASESVPREWQGPAFDYINAATRKRRADDLAGVIVFGKTAAVEAPPAPTQLDLLGIENSIETDHTDLAKAIKLALATFPEDSARRIVVLSDGNENRGSAVEQALAARDLDVQIDVVPIEYRYDREVLVEKVSVPPEVKEGETVKISVVIRASEPTRGTLQIFQKSDDYRAPAPGNEKPQAIELQRGINVFTLNQLITKPNFYTFTAEFVPDQDSGDRRAMNNSAAGFTQARGKGHVLLIEGTKGEHSEFVRALQEKKIQVTSLTAPKVDGSGDVGGDPMPTDLAQLQPYDALILGNVPKDAFTLAQHALFETNTHDMGAGLIMLGGPDSFGAGGWMNTPVEKALPVDMQIKALKVQGKSAMAMVMHATEIPEGNYWQKVIAKEAINTLSSYDYAGVLYWNGQESWLFTLRPIGSSRGMMLRAIDRMTPSDMPDFDPILLMAMRGLIRVKDAMSRHIVLVSDGDPAPPTPGVIRQLIANKITVTTVLTAAHGNDSNARNVMRNLANKTKGRFYEVTNPRALPRIYQKEARVISRPLIFEQKAAWTPKVNYVTEPLTGLADAIPPINGFVLATLKENELVEMPMSSPLPAGQVNPLLAHWSYGLGRSVAWTSDTGRKWTTAWPSWESYAAFWSQVVRWSMKPADRGNLALTLKREGGQIKVVVDALDKNDQFLNFLTVQGVVVSPKLDRQSLELKQTAPGRYEGVIDGAEGMGNYFVNLGYRGTDGAQGIISSGVSVPYSDEYRELRSNPTSLDNIASLTGGEVVNWKFRPDGRPDPARTQTGVDHFRRDPNLKNPRGFRDLWPDFLWLAAVLFLGDVAVRRIAPDVGRMRRTLADNWKKLRGQEVAPRPEYMEKLRGRKAEVDQQLERSRAATRYEAQPPAFLAANPDAPLGEPLLDTNAAAADRPRRNEPAKPAAGLAPTSKAPAPESYTNRLLKAKQKVWEDREKNKENPSS